jgi:RHS repeat-associated protein
MGCPKLAYNQHPSPLRLVKSGEKNQRNSVQVFMSVDPLADEYPGWSPYNYVLNNPLKFIDPTGLCPEEANGGWCIDDFGFENQGLSGRIMNYILSTNPEIGGENFNSREFIEVSYKGIADDVIEVVNEVKEGALNVAETSVGIGVLVADNVSLASDVALPAAFMFGPKAVGIVGGIGTAADVTSTVLKGVDLLMFDGTQEAFQAQAIKTGFNFTKAEGLKKIRQVQK